MPSSSADASAPKQDQAPTFEASLDRLSAIVERLEGGELPLEESLQLFEEGVRLARAAQSCLDLAEKRVEELLSIGADGAPIVRVLENGES
ncbi:MAG: exodeoxyribonuclease VII small subunit [Myxococcota bacterium]